MDFVPIAPGVDAAGNCCPATRNRLKPAPVRCDLRSTLRKWRVNRWKLLIWSKERHSFRTLAAHNRAYLLTRLRPAVALGFPHPSTRVALRQMPRARSHAPAYRSRAAPAAAVVLKKHPKAPPPRATPGSSSPTSVWFAAVAAWRLFTPFRRALRRILSIYCAMFLS